MLIHYGNIYVLDDFDWDALHLVILFVSSLTMVADDLG